MDVEMLVEQGKPHGKHLKFQDGEFFFGRGPECHVRPNSDWVSRQHCILIVSDEGCIVRDLGSTNGTLVNGQRIVNDCLLKPGDTLQVGPLVFRITKTELETKYDIPVMGDTDEGKLIG